MEGDHDLFFAVFSDAYQLSYLQLSYVYDTTSGGTVRDHREHCALLAHLMKRSTFFLAHRINDTEARLQRTGGEESLAFRYFEAAAGGAVMLGSEPRTPEFRACFDWPDAVIPLPHDSSSVVEILHDLQGQPDRLAAASSASVQASLLRHDWSYRWQRILADAGLGPETGLLRRLEQLHGAGEACRP